MSFSEDAEVAPGNKVTGDCYKYKLALATPHNKKYLANEYIKHLLLTGSFTFYIKAFEAAFDLFEQDFVNYTHPDRGK